MTDARSVSRAIALASTEAARDKQAADVVVLDVAELLSITDYFVICSGPPDRDVKTGMQGGEGRVRPDLRLRPGRREGEGDAGWWLLDYVDVVVHVFGEEQRAYYDLERLWRDAPRPGWAAESPARTAG